MDVDLFSQVLSNHGRVLNIPGGSSPADGRVPPNVEACAFLKKGFFYGPSEFFETEAFCPGLLHGLVFDIREVEQAFDGVALIFQIFVQNILKEVGPVIAQVLPAVDTRSAGKELDPAGDPGLEGFLCLTQGVVESRLQHDSAPVLLQLTCFKIQSLFQKP